MKITKIKKIKPLFTALITTMDRYEDDAKIGVLIDATKSKGTIKEYQKVVAIGENVRGVKEGDVVSINPARFAVKKHQEGSLKDGVITDNPVIDYRFDIVEMNDIPYLLLQDRDINYVIDEFEEDKPPIIDIPENKKIII